MSPRSALCEGFVSHRRAGAPPHAFRYPVFMTLLDLDELDTLDAQLRLFGHERARPVSFRHRDHLAASGAGVRRDLAAAVRAEGLTLPGGRVELLTNTRVFGYVFNPVSFFYCYDAADALALVVVEVNNTFGDRHAYVLPVEDDRFEWRRKKLMHVSPFQQPDAGSYFFHAPPPGERLRVSIDLTRGGETALGSALSLVRRPLRDPAIASALLRYPLMTVQVILAIHFQAFRLWRKGAPFWPRPPYDPTAAQRGPA